MKIKKLIKIETLKYLASGTAAFIVDYSILVLSFYVLGSGLGLATTLGYVSGFFVSYLFNRYWVFGKNGSTKKPTLQIVQYTSLVIFNYVFTLFSIKILDRMEVEPSISKILVMGIIVVWNYLIFQKIIFADRSSKNN